MLSTISYGFDTEIKTNSKPNTLDCSPDEKVLFSGLNNGNVAYWNLENPTEKNIQISDVPIISTVIAPNNSILALGLLNGTIVLVDLQNNNQFTKIQSGSAGIELMAIDPTSKLLCAASADKKIKILSLSDPNENPVVITDHNKKVRQLIFKQNILYALCADNSLRHWFTESTILADDVKKKIKRNLTVNEWKLYVGEKVKYETVD
jgi:WD40 repeat protein